VPRWRRVMISGDAFPFLFRQKDGFLINAGLPPEAIFVDVAIEKTTEGDVIFHIIFAHPSFQEVSDDTPFNQVPIIAVDISRTEVEYPTQPTLTNPFGYPEMPRPVNVNDAERFKNTPWDTSNIGILPKSGVPVALPEPPTGAPAKQTRAQRRQQAKQEKKDEQHELNQRKSRL
jgi:hypothetical protein